MGHSPLFKHGGAYHMVPKPTRLSMAMAWVDSNQDSRTVAASREAAYQGAALFLRQHMSSYVIMCATVDESSRFKILPI